MLKTKKDKLNENHFDKNFNPSHSIAFPSYFPSILATLHQNPKLKLQIFIRKLA